MRLPPRDHILLQLLQHVIEHPFAFQYYRRLISESHDTANPYIITHIVSSKLGVHGNELRTSL